MIQIDYELYPEWRENREGINKYPSATIDLGLQGTQTFVANGVNFQNAIPLAGFAASLLNAVRTFTAGGTKAYFCDLDSLWTLHFERVGDAVKIWDSLDRGPVTVSLKDFNEAVLHYVARFKKEFYELIPELRENEVFAWALDEERPAQIND